MGYIVQYTVKYKNKGQTKLTTVRNHLAINETMSASNLLDRILKEINDTDLVGYEDIKIDKIFTIDN